MLKKLAVALAASAFVVTLAAPVASACPGMDDTKVAKKDKDTKKKKAVKVANKTDKKKTAKKAKKAEAN